MTQGPHLKHERIAAVLTREIRSGRVRYGERLPGEVELAQRFSVSRNTVRAALTALAAEGLIATRCGKGSFVLFDGEPADERPGWARALTSRGLRTRVRVIRLGIEQDRDLAGRLALPSAQVVVIHRVHAVDGETIALERGCVPAIGGLRDLPGRGVDGITLGDTLEDTFGEVLGSAGLHVHRCEQWLRGRELDASEAEVLGRRPGEWFLHSRRISWTADDRFAEQVDSLLDPRHFELTLTSTVRTGP